MAKLYFHYATMNAGKTTMLLQASYNYRERGMATMLFIAGHYRKGDSAGVHLLAHRAGGGGRTVSRRRRSVRPHRRPPRAHGSLHCVFVDEAQFLEEEQVWQLARVADRLDIPVMCYGLRTDFQGKLFSGSQALLAIADELREVRTICRCGRKATMVVRLGPDGKVARQGRAGGDRQGRLRLALPPALGGGDGTRGAGGSYRVCGRGPWALRARLQTLLRWPTDGVFCASGAHLL